MPFSLDSSAFCCMFSIKHWTWANPNGSLTTVWSEPTLDSVSGQCPQSRTSRAHSCGSRPTTKTTSITGLVLWMSSWNVSCSINLQSFYPLTFSPRRSLQQTVQGWRKEPRWLQQRWPATPRKSVSRRREESLWDVHDGERFRLLEICALRFPQAQQGKRDWDDFLMAIASQFTPFFLLRSTDGIQLSTTRPLNCQKRCQRTWRNTLTVQAVTRWVRMEFSLSFLDLMHDASRFPGRVHLDLMRGREPRWYRELGASFVLPTAWILGKLLSLHESTVVHATSHCHQLWTPKEWVTRPVTGQSEELTFPFLILAGVLINIECKAWAQNIVHDRTDRRGSVHFELMVD